MRADRRVTAREWKELCAMLVVMAMAMVMVMVMVKAMAVP
jgi:hypothetical protein